MALEIFNRQELKFLIDRTQVTRILTATAPHMRADKHNVGGKTYRLYNLYIDTPDHALISHSLSKPVYKEKLRIRSYADFTPDALVFLEIKKRYKRITNKRRTQIRYADALAFIAARQLPQQYGYMNPLVVREIEAMLQTGNYHPKTFIMYDRLAFHSTDPGSDLRITFDTNLTARRFTSGQSQMLLPADTIIMEVKSSQNIPLWLVNLLSVQGIRKQSYSKYGQEYLGFLRGQQAGTRSLHA